jgi:hypothetical protein
MPHGVRYLVKINIPLSVYRLSVILNNCAGVSTFGAWKWEGTIDGREIKTYDGQEIKLVNDYYRFEVEDGVSMTGLGGIDLSSTKQVN